MQTALDRSAAEIVPLVDITRPRGALEITCIEDAPRLDGLRAEWTALLAQSGADCLFLTWEWLATWWKHLAEGRRLHLLSMRRDGELVGLVPLALRPAQPGRLLPFRAMEFMGMGPIGSDYLDIIVHPGAEEEVLQALAEYLQRHRYVLEFSRVDTKSPRLTALMAKLEEGGWSTQSTPTDACPYIPLQGHDWKSYLATVSRAHRANVNRRLRKLHETFKSVEFKAVQSEEERQHAFTMFLRLHQLRWSGKERSNAFTGPGTLAFHTEFSRMALEHGWLRLFILRLDGEPVASTYSFRYRDTFYYYQAGYDPKHSQHSVGLVTLALALRHAIEDGATRYDLLHGNSGYKDLWTDCGRPVSRVHCFPPSAGGVLYRRAVGLKQGIKRVVRWGGRSQEARA
ncbi:MAG TPA: GNAT family N-acetyltransferase [Gammaproteobacteria bacterium]|nr:GNAT family N-acetyltransferase [Gammaproteobacteria bacterium]